MKVEFDFDSNEQKLLRLTAENISECVYLEAIAEGNPTIFGIEYIECKASIYCKL